MSKTYPAYERTVEEPNRAWPGLLLALALLLTLPVAATHAATFTATLDRDTITLGENATLSLKFAGGTPRNVPSLPTIPNLEIDSAGSSQEMTTINGDFSASISYIFNLTPHQPGDYTIPAMAADVAGQHLATQPLTLKVLKPTAPPPEAIKSGTQQAFLRLILPKKEVYVGETIVAQLQIYVQNGIRIPQGGWQPTSFPADGFSVGKSAQGQQHQVQIGNNVYVMIPLSMALTAVKAGQMTLGPYTANLTLDVPSGRRSRDPFDPFGMFGGTPVDRKQVVVTTEAESVQLLPLPRENVPAGFNGAIGNYTMTTTAGPTNVAAGDPITIRIQISGRGSLDALALPDQPAWHDFNTYPPTTKVDTTDPLGLQGTKTFEQVVVPQNPDLKALPPVAFSFFDPERKAYQTVTQPAVAIIVRPGGAAAAPTVLNASRSAQDSTPPAPDIVPNKQRLGAVAQIGPPLLERPWFLAVQGLPAMAFLCALAWRKRTDQLANNPRLRRRRQLAQVLRDGLDQLRRLARQNNSDDFFATLVRLLQEQLGERLDLPGSAITEAVIEERLRPLKVPDSTLVPLQELFQMCNLARYSPVKSSEELAALIPKFEAVLRQLQEVKL